MSLGRDASFLHDLSHIVPIDCGIGRAGERCPAKEPFWADLPKRTKKGAPKMLKLNSGARALPRRPYT